MIARIGGGSLCIENQASTSLPQITDFTKYLYGPLNHEFEEFNLKLHTLIYASN